MCSQQTREITYLPDGIDIKQQGSVLSELISCVNINVSPQSSTWPLLVPYRPCLISLFTTVCLLVSAEVSLWGRMADFSHNCSPWRLRPGVSVPALGELTVCLHLQTKVTRYTCD